MTKIFILAVLYISMCLVCLTKLQPEIAVISVIAISFIGYFIVIDEIKPRKRLRLEYEQMLEELSARNQLQHSLYLCNLCKSYSIELQEDIKQRLINLETNHPHLFVKSEEGSMLPETSALRIEKGFAMWSGDNFEVRREFLIETINSLKI